MTLASKPNQTRIVRRVLIFLAVVVWTSGVSYLGIVRDSAPLIFAGLVSICLSVVWLLGWLRGGVRGGRAWLIAGAIYFAISLAYTLYVFRH